MSLLNDFCENRNALIVGGSSGIGLATGRGVIAARAARTVIIGRMCRG